MTKRALSSEQYDTYSENEDGIPYVHKNDNTV